MHSKLLFALISQFFFGCRILSFRTRRCLMNSLQITCNILAGCTRYAFLFACVYLRVTDICLRAFICRPGNGQLLRGHRTSQAHSSPDSCPDVRQLGGRRPLRQQHDDRGQAPGRRLSAKPAGTDCVSRSSATNTSLCFTLCAFVSQQPHPPEASVAVQASGGGDGGDEPSRVHGPG